MKLSTLKYVYILYIYADRLVLGDVLFDVAMGTRGGFLQELASIRPSEPEHSLAVLGQISQKLVYMCTPKLDTLLATNDGDR